jgi:phospholipid/cholesterol/gamma-HCH transport system ATP-binding protein
MSWGSETSAAGAAGGARRPSAAPGEVVIEVERLSAGYGGRPILEEVSFDVRRGEKLVVIGESGCGKSTLLKHMVGLLEPAAGSVKIEGRDIARARGRERREILRGIGVAYQSGALFGSLTLLENVALPLEELTRLPARAREAVARVKLEQVGLEDAADRYPSQLSGGMRKRAAIARAVALDPAILFLDEPTAGLDPVTAAGIDQLISRLGRSLGVTFVIVTHELASIFAVADRAVMLDASVRGILAAGAPAELARHPEERVRRFFRREVAEGA